MNHECIQGDRIKNIEDDVKNVVIILNGNSHPENGVVVKLALVLNGVEDIKKSMEKKEKESQSKFSNTFIILTFLAMFLGCIAVPIYFHITDAKQKVENNLKSNRVGQFDREVSK